MNPENIRYADPFTEIVKTANRLPHWEQDGRTYFMTFRLGDSVPAELLTRWTAERDTWLQHHPKPWSAETENEYHERFTHAMERWLDLGHGECLLRDPANAEIVAGALRFFDGSRVTQIAWVVMPNHVHVLFTLHSGWTLEEISTSWKTFTAREIHKRLGRQGHLWMRDYHDRLIRNPKHLENCILYIRNNPANLRPREYLHYESALAKSITTPES